MRPEPEEKSAQGVIGMEPLRVTWKFSSPKAVSPHATHLDDLVAWAVVNRATKSGLYDAPFLERENLPLAEEGGVWKASRIIFTPASEVFLVPFIRRGNPIDFAEAKRAGIFESNKNQFTVGTGPYKAFDLRLPVQWIKSATAWCIGDREEITSLLSDVTTIGKWWKNGYGRVKSLTVEQADTTEAERWRERALPAGSGMELPGVQYSLAQGRYRPPYWEKTGTGMVVIPA